MTVTGTEVFKIPKLTPAQMTQLGGAIVERLRTRVAAFRNLNDAPAKPYSTRGPVYVPVSGVGTIVRGLKGVGGKAGSTAFLKKNLSPEALLKFTEKRNKTSLGGREVFTKQDIAKLKRSGVIGNKATALGRITPSGKSVKFANYAAYKKALGKSGNRDLELSGRMLGSLGIVQQTDTSVTIGFTRHQEERKAMGNQLRDPWFGLSPADSKYLTDLGGSLLAGNLK